MPWDARLHLESVVLREGEPLSRCSSRLCEEDFCGLYSGGTASM